MATTAELETPLETPRSASRIIHAGVLDEIPAESVSFRVTSGGAVPVSMHKDPKSESDRNAAVVYVVDDDDSLRESLCLLLETVNLRTIPCRSAQEFLARYDSTENGCVLLDARMPGLSGLALHERLSAEPTSLPVIMLTGYPDVDPAVDAMKLGAFDYLQKPARDQQLLDTVARAIESDRQKKESNADREAVLGRFRKLSPRELEVLLLVLDGMTSKQIAAQLSIAPRTVELHRVHTTRKMEVESLAELVGLCAPHRALLEELAG